MLTLKIVSACFFFEMHGRICMRLLTLKIINACFFFEMHGRAKIAAGSSNSGSNSKAAAAAATAAADRAGTRPQGEGLMTLGTCKVEAAAQQQTEHELDVKAKGS